MLKAISEAFMSAIRLGTPCCAWTSEYGMSPQSPTEYSNSLLLPLSRSFAMAIPAVTPIAHRTAMHADRSLRLDMHPPTVVGLPARASPPLRPAWVAARLTPGYRAEVETSVGAPRLLSSSTDRRLAYATASPCVYPSSRRAKRYQSIQLVRRRPSTNLSEATSL